MNSINKVRSDFVPKDAYISREFAEQEKERLWPNVWQVACRLEEIPDIGSYVTFEVAGESLIIIRVTSDRIKSFHNVCQHRGRRLKEPSSSGKTNSLYCRYHGWSWKIDGSIERILDPQDWDGCSDFGNDALRLKETLVDTWGGFVFINMNPDAEPLSQYLAPMPEFIDPYEFSKLRYRWYKSIKLPCNWKVAVEAFNEGYHVAATHPQLLPLMGDDVTRSTAYGRHGMFGYPTATRPMGTPSPRLGKPMPTDIRPGVVEYFQMFEDQLKAIFTERDGQAATRLLSEVAADASVPEVLGKMFQFQKEAAEVTGAGWPALSMEQMFAAGTDWHVFPNLVFLMYPDGILAYRARPCGDDPDWCIYDIWSLARYAPGSEPALKREYYYGDDDWRTNAVEKVGLILSQDIQNMHEVQQGMKSRGFVGARPNPLQETSVSNFHRALREFLE